MSGPTWKSEHPPPSVRIGAGGWARVIVRGCVLAVLVVGGFGTLMLVRLVEQPFYGMHRPWTPHVSVFIARNGLRIFGIDYRSRGAPMNHSGGIVANHSSWLDIFVLNAAGPIYFVAKSEVAAWPGIGWFARVTGTVFVRREVREAKAQKNLFEERLTAGHRLLFFPEGTSTDGRRVLAFKPTLFAAFFSDALRDRQWIQPVTVVYSAPDGEEPRYYGWWGDMEFGAHVLKVLATRGRGMVEVIWHEPVRVADFADRKALARVTEAAVRGSHPAVE